MALQNCCFSNSNLVFNRQHDDINATTIQKHCRGFLGRRHLKEIKQKESNAATLLQSYIRQHAAQKSYEEEPDYSLFEAAKSYTEDPEKLKEVPNPSYGVNRLKIFMPNDLEVVIRACENSNDFSRFTKTQQAYAICFQHKFRCIEVPKVRMQRSFSVETRLPNANSSAMKGMAFYYQNQEHYTEAVKEFTSLLCYGSFWDDIIGGDKNIINYLGIAQVPRFDNLLLYSAEQENETLFKIGLVDLQTFVLNSRPDGYIVYQAMSTSCQLFPYHFDAILEQGKKEVQKVGQKEDKVFYNLSEEHISQLCEEASKSLEIYKIVCENNFSFYRRHNITLQNQMAITLSNERKDELKNHMGSFVRNMHTHGLKGYFGIRDCLKGDPDVSAHRFQEELCPKMIALVEERLKRMYSFSSKSKPTSYGELIEKRMNRRAVTTSLSENFQSDEEESDGSTLLREIFKSEFPPTLEIFEEILNQLVKGGELSYYKAHVYSSDDLIFF